MTVSSYRQPSPRGEGAPKGRIGHRRHERERGKSVSSRRFMKAPYPPLTRSPFPNGEGLRYENTAFLTSSKRIQDTWKNNTDGQSLSPWGKQRGGGFAAKKGSQPRLAALGSPFQGKGLAWTLPPSYGRRCPEGAEVGWGKRYPRNKAFPAWGRWRAKRAG